MSMSRALSSNHFSHDIQVGDVLAWLGSEHNEVFADLLKQFPEIERMSFDGAHFSTEAMDVDPEWSSWVADAIEQTGLVIWEEGEPWVNEPGERVLAVDVSVDLTQAWESWRIEVRTALPEEEITVEWLRNNPEDWEFIKTNDSGSSMTIFTDVQVVGEV